MNKSVEIWFSISIENSASKRIHSLKNGVCQGKSKQHIPVWQGALFTFGSAERPEKSFSDKQVTKVSGRLR